MGFGTRSELKKEIRKGSVSVGGEVVKDAGFNVSADSEVRYKGEAVGYEEFVYYMLNKPAGVISASDDPFEQTVVDLIDEQKRRDLFPTGRLDRDTEWLLLITNDGALAHRLLSPRHHVDKTYYVKVSGILTAEDADAFAHGLSLPDGLDCMPAELRILSSCASESTSEAEVTIREGKFHQIKRMFSALGKEVTYLKRLSMGTLCLDPSLEPGDYRRLTDEELQMLRG